MASATTTESKQRLAGRFVQHGRITAVDQLTPRMRRITLTLADPVEWMPGQQVRVGVAAAPAWAFRERRTYSIWAAQDNELQLAVLDHGVHEGAASPGARWAAQARPGQEVLLSKPQGRFVLRPASHYVFVGDETAAPAFGAILAGMISSVPLASETRGRGGPSRVSGTSPASDTAGFGAVCGVIEAASAADVLLLPDGRPWPAAVEWRYREGPPLAPSPLLPEAAAALAPPPSPGLAYVAGEARTVQAVARTLRQRGWARRAILTKPFWTPGRTGLD